MNEFLASNDWQWRLLRTIMQKPMSFNASRGDIYLDEENHTATCIRNDGTADLLGEFSISETGGIDCEPGNQTGRESWVHDYYCELYRFLGHGLLRHHRVRFTYRENGD